MDHAELERVLATARARYERARWRRSLTMTWPVFPLGMACVLAGADVATTILIACVLAAVVATALQRGQGSSRAVVPGLLAGVVPLGAGLLDRTLPHGCGGMFCTAWCAPLCLMGGALAGVWLAVRAMRVGEARRTVLLTASVIAVLTGGMGCLIIGFGGMVGLLTGMVVGTGLALIPMPRS